MKNTFNFPREKVNGFFPYVVENAKEEVKYLFEASTRLSLAKIIKIEQAFSDDQLIFATVDPNFQNHIYSLDAANVYEVGKRNQRSFYFYADGIFYDVEVYEERIEHDDIRRLRMNGKTTAFYAPGLPF